MVSSQPIVGIILSAIGAVYGSGEEGVRINEFKVRNAYNSGDLQVDDTKI